MSAAEARALVRRARAGSLATALAGENGAPYASLVTFACDGDISPILLFSDLSDHTRNLAQDGRAALLCEEASARANPQTGPRVTLLGTIARDDAPRLRRRFLARHPAAALYADFADFHVYRMTVARAHFVGGFARAVWHPAKAIVSDPEAAAAIAEAEEDVLRHMNEDHADAIDRFARRLGRRGEGWRMIGCDPEGCDLRRRASHARLPFPRPVADLAALRQTLVELARA